MKTEREYMNQTIRILQTRGELGAPLNISMFEDAFACAFRSLEYFAQAHESAYGSKIGADGVLGVAWLDMARALIAMLNGEHGRLDGGCMWRLIDDLAKSCGFEEGVEG